MVLDPYSVFRGGYVQVSPEVDADQHYRVDSSKYTEYDEKIEAY